jgi:phospholipid transport system substrate-binding protein
MLSRRHFLTFFVSIVNIVMLLPRVTLASNNTKHLESGAKDFIENLGKEALISLTKSELTITERRELFRDIMRRYFAFEVIAKWVLGRYWNRSTDTEKLEYLKLFEKLMIITYADRFQSYSGEKLVVIKSETRGRNNILVHTFLERPNDQEPIAVIWRLRAIKNSYKIIDVMVAGLSMGITQQKEFSSVIRKNDNKVEGLLRELRKRINVDT